MRRTRPALAPEVALLAAAAVVAASGLGPTRGRRAHAQTVAPSPVHVTLTTARPFMVLGTDPDMDVAVEVVGPGAEGFAPARTVATVGTLEAPLPTGTPGHFRARYVPPPERHPQVALLVVELASGAQRVHASLRLLLHGTTEVPLRTEAAAVVTLRIGERTFGPVAADRQGHVKIPVEVPPGIRVGVARAVDYTGNLRETDVDLQPAPFRRVFVLAPAAMEVGSFAEVTVMAIDGVGEPLASARLSLRASEGLVHPLGAGEPGEARFLVEAPRRVGSGALPLVGLAPGTPPGRAEVAIPLTAGRPHTLTLSPTAARLVIASGAASRVVISAHDQFGNPVSAEGARAFVDQRPARIEMTATGQGVVVVSAPARFDGTQRLVVAVSLGTARAAQEIRLTGGPPAGLTLTVKDQRLVADGRRGTELHVRAVDRNGTPTMIPGLSWVTPGGRIKNVRIPREGEYVADFVPDRASDPHRELVAVMASQSLRADGGLDVAPPPARLIVGARIGLFSNLGHAAGPAAFVEALTPVRVRDVRFVAGVAAGYLHDDIQTGGTATGPDVAARIVVDQAPILALLRYRLPALLRPELSFEAAAGLSFAHTRISAAPGPGPIEASARAVALEAGSEVAFPLRPGRLVAGLRYLWIALGRTSHGDDIAGNSAGLMADLGYRMTF